eukprot:403357633
MGGLVATLCYKKGRDQELSTPFKSLFDIPAVDINGNQIQKLGNILEYKSCILVVNVASNDKGFEILAFPCNQFMRQEPRSNQEIKEYVIKRFGVQFPLFEKCDVNGPNAHEVFKFLRYNMPQLNKKNKKGVKEVPWNFSKFLVNKQGKVVKFQDPRTSIFEMRDDIERLLQE